MGLDAFTVHTLHLAPSSIGVYVIRNTTNGKVYVGSVARRSGFRVRWNEHRRDLDASESDSLALQRAWKKYGRDAFTFEVVEVIERCQSDKETRSAVLAAEQRLRMVATQKARWTEEMRAEQSAKLRASLADPMVKARQSQAQIGRKHSPETLAKMREAQKRRYADPLEAARMREAQQRGAAAARQRIRCNDAD